MYAAVAIGLLFYMLFSARKSGKKAAQNEQMEKSLDNVGKANEARDEVNNLDPDDRRERLRGNK